MTPREYLNHLESDPIAWDALLERNDGSLPLAAHELARAREATRGYVEPHPTPKALYVAAQEICARTNSTIRVPSAHALASMCRHAGLLVLD